MGIERLIGPVVALAMLAGGAAAQEAALVVGNERYGEDARMANGRRVADVADALGRAGVEARVLWDAERDEIGQALRQLEQQGRTAEGMLVALSGRFVHSDDETWFLPIGSEGGSLVDATLNAIPLSSVMGILANASGRAILLLGTMLDERDAVDATLTTGIGPLDIPQGVTVIEAWPKAAEAILRDTLAVPGAPIRDRVERTEWARVRGFVSGTLSFLPEGRSVAAADESDGNDTRDDDGGAAAVRAGDGERAFWQRAIDNDTEQGYVAYLDAYPQGAFAEEATRRLAAVRQEPNRAARIVEDNLSLGRDARREIQRDLVLLGFDTRGIDGIFGPGTRGAIEAWQERNGRAVSGFLDRGAIDAIDAQAAERARELDAEREARAAEEERFWTETGEGGSEEGLVRFLERYPDGRYAERAERRLREIRDARLGDDGLTQRERQVWNAAREADDREGYVRYAREFPRGRFADRARQRVNEIDAAREGVDPQAEQAEAALGLSQITRRAVEQRLAAEGLDPGTVDGNFDARSRRAIRAYQRGSELPATGYLDQLTVVRLLADSVRRVLQ